MLTILCIFDASFVIRLISDIFTNHYAEQNHYYFWPTINAMVTPQVCDLIPICSVLYIHMRNFKVIKHASQANDTIEPEGSDFVQNSGQLKNSTRVGSNHGS